MASVGFYCGKLLLIVLGALFPLALLRQLWRRVRGRQPLSLNLWHETGALIFFAFLLGLAALTVVPAIEQTEGGLRFILDGGGRNFELGRVFRDTYYISYLWGNRSYFFINIVGNILIFLPVGLLPPLLWRPLRRWWRATLLGGLLSFLIEFSQLFIGRGSDVDDLWLNTLGALCGYLLFALLRRLAPRFCDRFVLKKS